MFRRVFLIVLDSLGIGELPDADEFGDVGSNTLRTLTTSKGLFVPTLMKMGLFNIEKAGLSQFAFKGVPIANFGAMAEKSKGKDTTIGHWEIAGIISSNPLPTYPNGFPDEVIEEFNAKTGKEILCNKPYSGTEVIKDFGDEHVRTGKLIVYTSADSVFQIAAHEKIVPLDELYHYCKIAREILKGKNAVGRVIARPFSDKDGVFYRTSGRHDYSLEPYGETMLDIIKASGKDVISVGKINDIFASRGITESNPTANNTEGEELIMKMTERDFNGLCFINLVDFDMVYGHRNDIDGYAAALTRFDKMLTLFLDKLKDDDILMLTADHGCDPGFPGTDHTREYVPLLVYGKKLKSGVNLGTRSSFSDIAATLTDAVGVALIKTGESFLPYII
ncbi:MAG: phosphopentomutase [Clostridiales bacterium GWF2_36_10]|nr:MAG: phosphopentomutase [Clostridiales bacterium GWF2_36_10]HAN21699.1 phosphopentomutase [Clostridiales bacterium]